MAKKKVAILGGGIGALTAAFQLTNTPNWNQELEVTIYQIGWRLGGKCATSRNPSKRNRIEEHGIHYLLGFYENTFHVIRQLYDECRAKSLKAPFDSWEKAFRKQSVITAMVDEGSRWTSFGTVWPTDTDTPGDPDRFRRREHPPTGRKLLVLVVKRMKEWIRQMMHDATLGLSQAQLVILNEMSGWLERAEDLIDRLEGPPDTPRDVLVIVELLNRLEVAMSDPLIDPAVAPAFPPLPRPLLPKPTLGDRARYLLIMLDIFRAMAKGMATERLFGDDFSAIDNIEFRAWLAKHGCRFPDFAVVRSGYDACFAYLGGDPARQSMSAAVALNGGLRLWLTYRGAIFWPMRGGMADVIFAPMYRLLRHRGVKFEFFNRVRALRLSSDKKRIERIDLDIQAELKDPSRPYEPLVKIGNIECWPDRPLYDQLKDANHIKGDMESAWGAPPPVNSRRLRAGVEFDAVVFGIALGAVKYLCPELIATSPAWKAMAAGIPTVQTQALQLWMNITSSQCGHDAGTLLPTNEPPCVSAFVKPFDTYVDQTDVKEFEGWLPEDDVQHLAYFCTTLEDAATIPEPGNDPGFPDRERERVRAHALAFIKNHLPVLFPNATRGLGTFNWDMLVDLDKGIGEKRLDGQYYRANIDPSARYVLSPPNTMKIRLEPDGSQFENLFLAGDWTFTPMNSGCVEAATMSGLRAAQAISGKPVHIYGWK